MTLVIHNGESKYTKKLRKSGLGNEYVCIVGGDGTLLRALKTFGYGLVPKVLAFNQGTAGYLLPLSLTDINRISQCIKKTRTVERIRMLVQPHNILVANELVIRSKMFQLNKFEIDINGCRIVIRACEIIVSTPAGTSGYNASLSGPLLLTEGIVLNSTGANRTNFIPVVIPSDSKIKISVNDCYGCFDGEEIITDQENAIFEISKGDHYEMVVNESYNEAAKITEIFKNL